MNDEQEEKMSDPREQLVEYIMRSRRESGNPCDWIIDNGLVIEASVSYGQEPLLDIISVDKFIMDHDYYFEEDDADIDSWSALFVSVKSEIESKSK